MNAKLINLCANQITVNKYSFIPSLLGNGEIISDEWEMFQNSWNNLEIDTYMGDKGKYRYRRYSVLSFNSKEKCFTQEPHQPHYQDLYYNNLNGGIKRHYAPLEDSTLNNIFFQKFLNFSTSVFNHLTTCIDWHIEVHQFRITIDNHLGFPTPEGIHRDGRKYILMTLIDKINVEGGITSLYDDDKNKIAQTMLTNPSDTLLVHDEETMHGVTAIKKINMNENAYRDVLVVTFIEKGRLNYEQ